MNRPQRILCMVIGIVIAMALFDTLVPWGWSHPGAVNVVGSLILGLCAFAWVKADAQARDITPPVGSALFAALLIPIGVPVYLFRALGARQGAWSSLKAYGFLFCAVVTYLGVSYVAEFLR